MELIGKIMFAFLIRLGVLGVLAIGGVISIAQACSPVRDYVRHTSYDLVEQSDAIVIAEAVESLELGRYKSGLRFKVLETIKGDAPGRVDLPYVYLKASRSSDPLEISAPHPPSLHGKCNRSHFSKNAKYILMLKQVEDGSWHMFGGPFTRNAEDYHGPDSYWVRAIETYLDVQKRYAPMMQLEVLYSLRVKHKDAEDGSFEQALAHDIKTYVRSLSSRKPTPFLIDAYEAVEATLEGEKPALGGFGSSILDVLRESAEDDSAPVNQEYLEYMRIKILRQFSSGNHAGAADLINRIVEENPSAEELSAAMLFFNSIGDRQRGIDLFEQEGWAKITTGSKQESNLVAYAFYAFGPDDNAPVDDQYSNWWARTMFNISELRLARFNEDEYHYLKRPLEILKPERYREEADVTLALARYYDEDVIAWAEAEITQLLGDAVSFDEEAYALPIGALLESYKPEHSEGIERLLCHSQESRIELIKAYGLIRNQYNALDLLKYIANAPLSEKDREALTLSITEHIDKLYAHALDSRYTQRRIDDFQVHLDRIAAGKPIFMPAKALPLWCAPTPAPN